MLKFFRNIRLNLLSEGKTGKPAHRTVKYLKYALGEIILVVIGILIALSINNWNENRKLVNQSNQALQNLEDEIVEGKTELEDVISYLEQKVEQRITFLNNKGENLADSQKIQRINRMIFFYTQAIKLPIVESELGPEKKIIHWPELTENMQDLVESIEYYNKGLDYLENDMYSNVIPYSVQQGLIVDIMKSDGLIESKDYQAADTYSSENFQNVVAISTLMITDLLEAANRIMENYDQLLLSIREKN
ncbi:DUF6090 family protein [Algoriphagus namhaensis]|uniref:DUF6090 family protein n=1 Tax=Algoriphagus namhaensis TaxID=915353 RepID=A0ABV8AW26_9BACT